MKIVCHREKLLSAFQTAATVVPSRSPKAVLQNVKMDAQSDCLTLIATDMEVGIRIEIADQNAEVPGTALLSVSEFGSILRESSDETLRIESDGNSVQVKGERSRFKFPTSNPAEFPDVLGFDVPNFYQVHGRLLRELIRRTLFATDAESSRYAFGGVLVEFEAEQVTAVGTDGRRLAKMDGPCEQVGEPTASDTMTIVPSRSMQLIERAIMDLDATYDLTTRGNDFIVRCPSATIITRLVEGRFPRWRDVLPHRPGAYCVEIVAGPLHSALRQASVVTSKESRGIDFQFTPGTLTLLGLTADVGESRVELPIAYDGPEIIMRLDHRFVSEFLRVLDPERTFTLNLVDGENAALFETDDGYSYVVMPLAREEQESATTGAASTA